MIQTDEKPLNLRLFTCVTAAAVLLAGAYYLNLEQLYYMAGMLGGVPLAAYLFSRIPLGRLRVERRAPACGSRTPLDAGSNPAPGPPSWFPWSAAPRRP